MINGDRIRGVFIQLRALLNGRAVDEEMDEEMAFHIEMETRNNVSKGMNATSARRAALLSFNGVDRNKELVREARWTSVIDETIADARFALRSLRRTPSFTLIAVTTLSLGIAANGTIFSLLNALVFRPPTGVHARNVVWVNDGGHIGNLSYADLGQLQSDASSGIDLATYMQTDVGLAVGQNEPALVSTHMVSANYFSVLGVSTIAGRTFVPEENNGHANSAVAVISDAAWQRLYGRSQSAIGSTVRINGHPFTIIGVASKGFTGIDVEKAAELWVPIMAQPVVMPRPYDVLNDPSGGDFTMVGRVQSNAEMARIETLLNTSITHIRAAHGLKRKPVNVEIAPMRGWIPPGRMGQIAGILAAAWVVTGMVLLIVCANIANLLLSRSAARQREFGVRSALGARRSRIIRLFSTEALVLSVSACAIAVVIAWAAGRMFQQRFLASVITLQVAIDWRTIVFAMAIAIGSALMFGLVPALRFSRPDVVSIIKGGSAALHRTTAQRFFIVAQVAMSVVLLIAGALFVQRMRDARNTSLGFDPAHVVVTTFNTLTRGYNTAQTNDLFARMRGAVQRIPGVTSVTGPGFAPFSHGGLFTSAAPMEFQRAADEKSIQAVFMPVSRDFFATLSIPLLRGRYLDSRDDQSKTNAIVVSESFARALWHGDNPIGRLISIGPDDPPLTVVGLVPDAHMSDVNEKPMPHFYRPYTQSQHLAESHLMIRTSGDPAASLSQIRAAIRSADPDLALFDIAPLSYKVNEKIRLALGFAAIVGGFAVLALILAAIGLYGLVAFSVVGRTKEIGVRIALGARPSSVVAGFVREALGLCAKGLVIGGLFSYAFAKLLAGAVPGIHGASAFAIACVVASLLGVTGIATIIPAMRAGRVEPMRSLRVE